MQINRPEYLKQLISFCEKQLIKVVNGIRRCGKSTLFKIYQQYLREQGITEAQIISLNLENPDYRELYFY